MLEISGLSIKYGAVEVVHGVSMRIEEGQIVALIGPNGAGKSSVLRAVSGIKRPSSGNITFLGASIVGGLPHKIVAAGISHVMEGRHLFSGLSVEDNLLLAASSVEGGSGGSLEEVYRRWPILKERTKQLAGNMSGGEQQMLAIARALMTRPRLVILDEPSWGLAPRVVRELMHTITQLRSEGITIFLCEQMANLALKICDYGYVMSNGRVVMEGSAEELLSNPDLQATYLGGEVGEADYPKKESARRGEEKQARVKTKIQQNGSPLMGEEPRMSSKVYKGHERSGQPEKLPFYSSDLFADLKEEVARIRRDIDIMKETHDISKSKLSVEKNSMVTETQQRSRQDAEKRHQSESQAYNDLFDPILSKMSVQEQEKGKKVIEASHKGKHRQHRKEETVSLPTDNQQAQQTDYKSREIDRQQKQKKWQEENKF